VRIGAIAFARGMLETLGALGELGTAGTLRMLDTLDTLGAARMLGMLGAERSAAETPRTDTGGASSSVNGLRLRRRSIHATTALAAAIGEAIINPSERASDGGGGAAPGRPESSRRKVLAPAAAEEGNVPGAADPAPTGPVGAKSSGGAPTPGATFSSVVTTIRNPLSAFRLPGGFRHRAALRPRFGSRSHEAPRKTRRSASPAALAVTSGSTTAAS
jgi:hypothetical protein